LRCSFNDLGDLAASQSRRSPQFARFTYDKPAHHSLAAIDQRGRFGEWREQLVVVLNAK
jgi:hypothetical protein